MEKGFKAMKIRCWRPDPMEDVAVVRAVKEAVGDEVEALAEAFRQAVVADLAEPLNLLVGG